MVLCIDLCYNIIAEWKRTIYIYLPYALPKERRYSMEETKKSSYNGYTDARKEANKRYMENFVEIKVRTTPQHRETVKAHASSTDESVNSFIIRAIDETIQRDNKIE